MSDSAGRSHDLATKADEQQLQQGATGAQEVTAPITDMLAGAAGMVQGMMAAMGAPTTAPTEAASALMQSSVVNPDGTTTTNIGTAQPSEDARTASSYDPDTNTVTTTTVEPATGSFVTTSTTSTAVPVDSGAADAAGRAEA